MCKCRFLNAYVRSNEFPRHSTLASGAPSRSQSKSHDAWDKGISGDKSGRIH